MAPPIRRGGWLAVVALGLVALLAGPSAGAQSDSALGNRSAQVRPAPTNQRTDAGRPAPGRVVVRFRADATAADVNRALSEEGLSPGRTLGRLHGVVARVDPGREAAVMARLSAHSAVASVERDFIVSTLGNPTPTDPLYATDQWNLPQIGMPQAWGVTVGASSVRVAVIDTGIDFAHEDLATQWAYASGHSAADHVFLSTPLSSGCSAPGEPSDDNGHGSHVSGTIAAASTISGAPSVGIAGVAPGLRVIPLKALDCQGSGYLSDVAAAIDFAATSGAVAINMSLGGALDTGCPGYLQSAIDHATANGLVVVAAAGNDGTSDLEYPAGCNGVAGVGATDSSDRHAAFSNQNSSVAITAPGVRIVAPWNDGGYAEASGTSMSTPHVSACAALMKSASPGATASTILSILEGTAADLGAPGWDSSFGWGRLNCGAAVSTIATGSTGQPTGTPSPGTTATPPVTGTPSPGSIGGRNLAVTAAGSGVQLSWDPGTGQSGYLVARLANGVLSLLPPAPLPASQTGYLDTGAVPGLNCYSVFPLGPVPQQQSDLECASIGVHTPAGNPQNLTVRLNQSTMAALTWGPPNGPAPTGYVLATIGAGTEMLANSVTSASRPTNGLTCFIVGALNGSALVGYSDIVCGLPGFSTF